jgi:hypothetical protein
MQKGKLDLVTKETPAFRVENLLHFLSAFPNKPIMEIIFYLEEICFSYTVNDTPAQY